MKKSLFLFVLSMVLLAIIVSCSDGVQKMFQYENPVRIEYSKCTGCLECIEDFQCPQDAIKKDPNTGFLTNYIDTEKCIQCMRCINNFHCPDDAITIVVDQIKPAAIEDFLVTSDSLGTIVISFIAPGDDGMEGHVYQYDLSLTDTEGNPINYDFEFPLLQPGGETEEWVITDLEPNQNISVSLQASDEMGLKSPLVITIVSVMGIYVDDILPGQITDLIAESGEDNIILNWTAPGDDGEEGAALGYVVKYWYDEITDANWQTANVYEQELSPQTAGSPEEIIVSNIQTGLNNFYAVRAYDEENNLGPTSNNAQAVITGDVTNPADITTLEITNISINSIQLSWIAVGDNGYEGLADAYVIKISEEEITASNWNSIVEYNQNIIPSNSGSTETLFIENLEAVTHYYGAVKVVDEVGNVSNLSNVVEATTLAVPDTTPPAEITDLSAEPTEINVTLNWTAPGDDGNEGTAFAYIIKKYNLPITNNNWQDAQTLENPPNPQPANSQETLIINDLIPNETYYFAIKAIDEEDNISDLSNVVETAILLDVTAPNPITNLAAVGTESEIMLTWTASGDDGDIGAAQSYQIKWSLNPIVDSNWDSANIIEDVPNPAPAGSNESLIIADLDSGIDYYFAIKVLDDEGNLSDLSNIASAALIQDNIAPNPVTDLEVVTGDAPGSYSIKVIWTATGDDGDVGTVEYYEVKYSLAPISEANWGSATLAGILTDTSSPGSTEQYTVSGLDRGVIYYFAVKPFDNAGNTCDVSNTPQGKIVFIINAGPCNGCGRCVSHCDQDAITDHGSYASIDTDLCIGCGDCVAWCPRNAIQLSVVIP